MLRRTTMVKLVLVAAGLGLVGIGIRSDNAAVRWSGIGLVAAAWLLRFAKEKPDD